MTNPGTQGRRAVRALSAFLGCALLAALSSGAWAEDKKTVVILEIQGGKPPTAASLKQLQQSITNALQSKYILVPVAKWNFVAKRLKVAGQQPEDVAMVAAELKVDAVITGRLKQEDGGQWKLNIAARNGQTGKPLGKMTYDLKGAKVEPDIIAQVEKDVGPAVEKAIKGEPQEAPPAVASSEPPPANLVELGKDEDPIAQMMKLAEQQRRLANANPRPVYYPYIDISVAPGVSGRSFSYTENSDPASNVGCYDFVQKRPDPTDPTANPVLFFNYGKKLNTCPRYNTSLTFSYRVDLTAYPLAGLRANPIRGLGIGVTFDHVIWPDSITGGANSASLPTKEFRFEVGLRYHYNLLNKRSRPSILANIQYGGHFFSVAKQEKQITFTNLQFAQETTTGLDDHGLPDIFYQYLTIGAGIRVPYFANDKIYFGLVLSGNLHVVFNYGEIANPLDGNAAITSAKTPEGAACADPAALYCTSGYGPVGISLGGRGTLTLLELIPWRGLTFRLEGYGEVFQYGFQFGSNANANVSLPDAGATFFDRKLGFGARHIAQGASDLYFGGMLKIGYQY